MPDKGKVLVIAGSDSGGGAGIQADIKAIMALDGYATTALTALTAQNTQGVQGIHDVPTEFIIQQITSILADIGADSIKTGMLHRSDSIHAICDILEAQAPKIPIVADPVMVAKGGHSLLQEDATEALSTRLLPLAHIITPNIPEAALLAQIPIRDVTRMEAAAQTLKKRFGCAVLLKGGHLESATLTDILIDHNDNIYRYEDTRIDTKNTHGTGCTLASAIATGLAQKKSLKESVEHARAYVRQAILSAPKNIGHGHGPLEHKVCL